MSLINNTPYSALASLLHGLTPRAAGYDRASATVVYPQGEKELERLASHANATRFTLAGGLAVMGKLLVREEAAPELEPADIMALGDMLATFGETLLVLEEMETSAKSALAEIARRAQHGEGQP